MQIQPVGSRVVSVVVDTPCWFDDLGMQLAGRITASGAKGLFLRDIEDIPEGGIAFFLSCMKIVPEHILRRSVLNAVVHASALPHGRGFSPQVWQVLEGKNEIPVTMFEAIAEVDRGPIIKQDVMRFEGHELNAEMRKTFGEMVQRMCLEVATADALPARVPQEDVPGSWYRRRYPRDSELSPHKTLAEQFDLLRVVDNERYPAFFDHRGQRYILKIEKA